MKLDGTVPGDLVTDLERADLISDPLTNNNFQNSSYWNGPVWEYQRNFTVPSNLVGTEMLLVFDGIKMGAAIFLNGQWLGNATDQFLRYNYSVRERKPGKNRDVYGRT